MYPDLTRSLEPATLGLVGLTPLLAVCTTLLSGLFIGLAYVAVALLTGLTVSCARRFIPERLKLIYLLLISAAWVACIDVLMQAGCHALREQLGIYLFLLAMNTTLLFHLEAVPLRRRIRESAPATLKTALAGLALLTATGLLRELLASGGSLTDIQLLSHIERLDALRPVYLFAGGLPLFDTDAGAFLVFGLLLAALSFAAPGRGQVS